jgi:hypothetical protein
VHELGMAAVLGLTSLGGYLLATRRHGLSPAGLRAAIAATLEAIGLGILFLLGNLTVILIPLLGGRALGGGFVSIYWADYVSIAMVSLLQGVVLRWWWDRG